MRSEKEYGEREHKREWQNRDGEQRDGKVNLNEITRIVKRIKITEKEKRRNREKKRRIAVKTIVKCEIILQLFFAANHPLAEKLHPNYLCSEK